MALRTMTTITRPMAPKSSGFGDVAALPHRLRQGAALADGDDPAHLLGHHRFCNRQLLHKSITDGDRIGLVSLPITAVIAATFTAVLTRLINKVMPRDESNAKSLPQLVGEEGTAILPIDDHFGLAKVHDGSSASIQVPCRVALGTRNNLSQPYGYC